MRFWRATLQPLWCSFFCARARSTTTLPRFVSQRFPLKCPSSSSSVLILVLLPPSPRSPPTPPHTHHRTYAPVSASAPARRLLGRLHPWQPSQLQHVVAGPMRLRLAAIGNADLHGAILCSRIQGGCLYLQNKQTEETNTYVRDQIVYYKKSGNNSSFPPFNTKKTNRTLS